MKQWLEDRGAPVSMEQSPMHPMSDLKVTNSTAHMNMGSTPMNSMTMMPGMLTPQHMMALEQARGVISTVNSAPQARLLDLSESAP